MNIAKNKNTIVGITIAILLIATCGLGWAAYTSQKKQDEMNTRDEYVKSNNRETVVSLDQRTSIKLPCSASSRADIISDDPDLLIGNSICDTINDDYTTTGIYKTTAFYTAGLMKYRTSAAKEAYGYYDYSKCVKNPDYDEVFTVIDSHRESVHGIDFYFCTFAGNMDSYFITARTRISDTVYDASVMASGSEAKGLWPKFRGIIETFNYR